MKFGSFKWKIIKKKFHKSDLNLSTQIMRIAISLTIFDLLFIRRAYTMSWDWKEMDRLEAIRAHIKEREGFGVWNIAYGEM